MTKECSPLSGNRGRLAGWLRPVTGGLSISLIFLLIEFFDELHYGVFGAALPALRSDLGLTYTQIGLLLGLPGVVSTFIEPLLLLLGDTAHRKRIILAGGLVIMLVLLVFAAGAPFPLLLAAMIAAYPASGAFVSLSQATLIDLHPGREAPLMARWTVMGSVGGLLGPLALAGLLWFGWGWQPAFLLLAALALLLWAALLPQRFPHTQEQKTGSPGLLLRALASSLGDGLRDSRLMRWVLLLQVSDLLLDVFFGYLTLYFTDVVGLSAAQAGLALALLTAANLASDLALVPLLERFHGRSVVRVSALAAGALYVLWLLIPHPTAKLVLLLPLGFSTLGWYSVLLAEAFAAAPGRSGTVSALNSLAGILGGAITYAIGWTAGLAGLGAAMWLLLLAPLCLALFVPRPGNDDA